MSEYMSVKELTLVDFINNINKIFEDLMHWEVKEIIPKTDKKHDFLKWEKSTDDICPEYCNCDIKDDDENFKCKPFIFDYYVKQYNIGEDGDSFRGIMVYDLEDYYVKINYWQ